MYCRYCGEPIDPGTLKCTSCGRENGPLTNGSSFWDVAGKKERGKLPGKPGSAQEETHEAAPVPPVVPVPGENNAGSKNTGKEKGRRRSPLPLILQGVCLLAAVAAISLLVVLIGKLNRISSQNDQIESKIEAVSKAPAAAVDWESQARNIIEDEKKPIQQSIKSVQDKIDGLTRKIDGFEPTLSPDELNEIMAELEELEFKLAQMESKLDEINSKIPETTEAPPEETEELTEEPEEPTEEPEAPTEEPEAPTEEPENPIEEPEAPTEEPEAPTEELEATSEQGGPTLPWSEFPFGP